MTLFEPFSRLTLSSVIDILAVAFVIYQFLAIVRGTRAAHVLAGIVTVIVVYIVSGWAGLETLRSLLAYLIPYSAIAAVVLFQTEIRRTLARIGRKNWFARGFRRPESTDEVLLALSLLSEQRAGALIVLEKDTGLRTFIESGVRLDAEISRDLLLSIFYPGGALHDGAVIIQKEKISAAACFLPLSTNPAISSKFGTRHRAAIGITEETDCMSLVVSEETGAISVAVLGELEYNLTVQQVDERIHKHFGSGRYSATAGGTLAPSPEEVTPEEVSEDAKAART
jgi:diadenylate cyclase